MKKILLAIITLLMFCPACESVHEFPEEPGVDPSLIDVNLSVVIDMNLNDEDPITQTYRNMLGDNYDIRYIVEIYEVTDSYAETIGHRIKRIEKIEQTIIENGTYKIDEDVQLHAGVYSVMAWVDFIKKGTNQDYYYNKKSK